MEFKFNVQKLLKGDATGMVVLDGSKGNPYERSAAALNRNRSSGMYFGNGPGSTQNAAMVSEAAQVNQIIDMMGQASSKAQ